jgi:hypothetical protein
MSESDDGRIKPVGEIWNPAANTETPWIKLDVPDAHGHATPLFSLDERWLTVVLWRWHPDGHAVEIFDLTTGKRLDRYYAHADHFFYDADGNLHYVRDVGIHDSKTGKVVRRHKRVIDGLEINGFLREFAIHQKGKEVRVYSLATGDLAASATLPSDQMGVMFVSNDAKIIIAQGWPQGAVIAGMGLHQAFIDTTTGQIREEPSHEYGRNQVFSPDGQIQVWFGDANRPAWLKKLLPMLPDEIVRVRRWATNEELAHFSHVTEARFTPDGKHLAMLRSDHVIDVYEFPFRTPWGLIIGAAVLAAAFTWSVGWIWTRWRSRRAISPAPDTPPR